MSKECNNNPKKIASILPGLGAIFLTCLALRLNWDSEWGYIVCFIGVALLIPLPLLHSAKSKSRRRRFIGKREV